MSWSRVFFILANFQPHHLIVDPMLSRRRSWPNFVWSIVFITLAISFASFSTCFSTYVLVFLYYRALEISKPSLSHFLPSFFKTWPYHCMLVALTILSKNSSLPNMSIRVVKKKTFIWKVLLQTAFPVALSPKNGIDQFSLKNFDV